MITEIDKTISAADGQLYDNQVGIDVELIKELVEFIGSVADQDEIGTYPDYLLDKLSEVIGAAKEGKHDT